MCWADINCNFELQDDEDEDDDLDYDQNVGVDDYDDVIDDAEFADDFPVEAVAGKKVSYDLTVPQVKEREIPEIDDNHAKAMGAESLDSLKENVRGQFEQQQQRTRGHHFQDA